MWYVLQVVQVLYRKIHEHKTELLHDTKNAIHRRMNFVFITVPREATSSRLYVENYGYFRPPKLKRNRRNSSASELVACSATSEFPCRAYM